MTSYARGTYPQNGGMPQQQQPMAQRLNTMLGMQPQGIKPQGMQGAAPMQGMRPMTQPPMRPMTQPPMRPMTQPPQNFSNLSGLLRGSPNPPMQPMTQPPMQPMTQPPMQSGQQSSNMNEFLSNFKAQMPPMQPSGLGGLAAFGGFNPMQPMTQPPMQPMTQPPMQPMTQPPMQPMTQPPMQPFGIGDGGAGLDSQSPQYAQTMQQFNAMQGQQVGNTGQMAGPMTQPPMQPMGQRLPAQPMTQPPMQQPQMQPPAMPQAPNTQQVRQEPPRMQAARNIQRMKGYNR